MIRVVYMKHITDFSRWTWDFVDGNSSHEENPLNTYAELTKNKVQLTVSDNTPADKSIKTNSQFWY